MEQTSDDVDKQSNGSATDEDELSDEDELAESLIKRSYKWPQLKQLVFKYNNLKKIDESLVRIVYSVVKIVFKILPLETDSLS